MKIQFEPTKETIKDFGKLLRSNPNETPDTLLNRLIQDAAAETEPELERDELLDVVSKVSAFIVKNHKPLQVGNVRDYLDICFKRGIVAKDYTVNRSAFNRICKWVMDDLLLHAKIRSMSHVVPSSFIRDY